jgi:hypothetical protein
VVVVVGIGRIEEEESDGATVPAVLQYRGYCSQLRGRGPAARALRGAGNAGRGASPMAGKREDFSFLLLN